MYLRAPAIKRIEINMGITINSEDSGTVGVGVGEGLSVGLAVGLLVGFVVGAAVGLGEGTSVGLGVGIGVGMGKVPMSTLTLCVLCE